MANKNNKCGNGKVSRRGKRDRRSYDKPNETKTFRSPEQRQKFVGDTVSTHDNDPQWYYKSEDLLKDVASFSYMKPLGNRLGMNKVFTPNDGHFSQAAVAVPGLMTLRLAPTPGVSVDAQSPMNLGAQNVYSFVRYKNSGAANYDAPDLMLYLLAMDSCYSCWNWMKRIYGMASTYSATNRYKPAAYLKSNRVDLNDIYEHLADFRSYLNMAADRLSAFCVPAVFSYMVRHSWLYTHIYKDSDTIKAQEYMYVPDFFYKYSETSSPNGGELTPVNIMHDVDLNSATLFTFSDLRNIMDSMINALQYSEDIGIMSGDIKKAYSESGLFTVSHVDPDYKVEAVYDKEVLTQFENAQMAAFIRHNDLASFNIKQDPNTNFIKYQPTATVDAAVAQRNGDIVNFHWQDPTPQDMMVATRLNAVFNVTKTGETYTAKLVSCGSELVMATNIWILGVSSDVSSSDNGANASLLFCVDFFDAVVFTNANTVTAYKDNLRHLLQIYLWQAFDWAPKMMFGGKSPTDAHVVYFPWLKDYDMYTTVMEDNYESMNLLALNSNFNIPN